LGRIDFWILFADTDSYSLSILQIWKVVEVEEQFPCWWKLKIMGVRGRLSDMKWHVSHMLKVG
jgi:hypothetical protein